MHPHAATAPPDEWHQVVITDPHNLSGQSTQAVLRQVLDAAGSAWVHVGFAEGALDGLRDRGNSVLDARLALELVAQADQYDWGLLHLFAATPGVLPDPADPREGMAQADHTLYLVDDTCFYLYTRATALAEALVRAYPGCQHRTCSLADLDVPY